MWVSLILSVEGLKRKKTDPQRKRKDASTWSLDWSCDINPSLGLQSARLPWRFLTCNLYNPVSQFLKTSLPPSCTLPQLSPPFYSLCRTLTNTHGLNVDLRGQCKFMKGQQIWLEPSLSLAYFSSSFYPNFNIQIFRGQITTYICLVFALYVMDNQWKSEKNSKW